MKIERVVGFAEVSICEYFFENACYSVTKYYLCKQNNKRSLLGRKQRHQVVRSFPNRYLFSLTNKLTFLFPISCILDIILSCNLTQVTTRYASCYTTGIQIWGNAFSFLIFEYLFSGTWKAMEKKCNNIAKM